MENLRADMIGKAGSYIITKGMGVNHKACEGLITTHFSLYCIKIEIREGGGGGGYYPKDAWNKVEDITNFFQPTDSLYDPDRKYLDKKEVKIIVEFGKLKSEKIYLVPINKIKILVNILNIINTTKERINIKITDLKSIIHNISVFITGFHKK